LELVMLTNKRGTMLRVCDAARSGLAVPRLKNIVASPSRAVAALNLKQLGTQFGHVAGRFRR